MNLTTKQMETLMGDPNYPDDIHQYDNRPGSPFYDDPTETIEFENEKERQYFEKLDDTNGWFIESFSQAEDSRLIELAEALKLPPDEKSSIRIGDIVRQLVEDYCQPSDDEVL